jgi:hypothetical protein
MFAHLVPGRRKTQTRVYLVLYSDLSGILDACFLVTLSQKGKRYYSPCESSVLIVGSCTLDGACDCLFAFRKHGIVLLYACIRLNVMYKPAIVFSARTFAALELSV